MSLRGRAHFCNGKSLSQKGRRLAHHNSLSLPARVLAPGVTELTACFAAFRSSSSTKGCRSLNVKPMRSPLRHAMKPAIGSWLAMTRATASSGDGSGPTRSLAPPAEMSSTMQAMWSVAVTSAASQWVDHRRFSWFAGRRSCRTRLARVSDTGSAHRKRTKSGVTIEVENASTARIT